ncbi:hypothetical protein Y717_29940 [Streptomyces scopuliridis RB72]|uniref:Uncharacterized protein n=1 Tax=Streptomyces scopuliridis RB72 TaxID=1440053 RepID=A0A2T7T5U4_9ACTN|nr:hypothetical protein Y717_29940 [Streptomyces scopuliridis RB72]
MILYLPPGVPVSTAGTRIEHLTPQITIVFVAIVEHNRVSRALSLVVQSPRDPGFTLFVKLGFLDILPGCEVSTGEDVVNVSKDSSIRSHMNMLPTD